jgi:S1-C subfamily serine protease
MPAHNRFSLDPYWRVPPRTPRKPYRPFLTVVLIALPALLVAAAILFGLSLWLAWHTQGSAAPVQPSTVQPRPVTARGDLAADEQSTIELFRSVSPSVVHVTNLATKRDWYSRDVYTVARGSGTGFIWDEHGFIVTNFHVVDGATMVRVVLADGSRYDSNRVWGYPDQDLAVIQIDAPKAKLRPIAVGTSQGLQVGQRALAIGNPFGLDHSLTTGVISALNREIESSSGRPIRGVIQTSAAINPGNSGGPLLDSAGRLIGVNTAIVSPSGASAGIGFAIPVDEVNRLVPKLVAHGKASF